MLPVIDSACRIPTDADALCNTAVKAIPTRIPRNGFVNIVSMFTKCSFSFRGDTAPLIVCIPTIRIANPSMMSPTFLYVDFLKNILNTIPTIATTAEIVAVERSCAIPLDPSIYDRHRIHPVILVPILAPMMIPIACATFIIPELTNPTTITVVADDDWMIAVTTVPKRSPLIGVLVSLYNTSSSLFPATLLSPSPIRDIPKRNKATPLNSDRIIVMPLIF